MNDIRRSLLWAVFGISVVMLWDAWQVHNGNAPLFFNQPAKTTQLLRKKAGCLRRVQQHPLRLLTVRT